MSRTLTGEITGTEEPSEFWKGVQLPVIRVAAGKPQFHESGYASGHAQEVLHVPGLLERLQALQSSENPSQVSWTHYFESGDCRLGHGWCHIQWTDGRSSVFLAHVYDKRRELHIPLTQEVSLLSSHRELTAGEYVHIRTGTKMTWRRTAAEIHKDPAKFLADFADALIEHIPSLCRQVDQVLVVELQAAWMAIGPDAIGFYTEADAAATFGREEPGTERVYWHVDEIREDPALVVGAILGMISENHSVETGE